MPHTQHSRPLSGPFLEEFRSFLAIGAARGKVDLCLPVFASARGAPLKQPPQADGYRYNSETLARRDVRSALHVQQLLNGQESAAWINLCSPEEFLRVYGGTEPDRVGFLFGSRSNGALKETALRTRLDRLVTLSFGSQWTIRGQDQREFSIPNPSKLTREEYASHADYAVVARVHDTAERPIFFIAGLGGRATEGGGYFLLTQWEELHRQMGSDDFAVVLSFPPPVAPETCEVVARYRA
jgi:hypothetical protein